MSRTRTRGLLTPWGERLDPDRPLPEYPRPQLVRDSLLNLNGRWEHAVTSSMELPSRPDGPVVVPFPLESLLSGVGRVLQPDEVLHYRRCFALSPGFLPDGHRLLLHFGAVDRWCRVLVNGRVAGEHATGFLPFRFDITDLLEPGENELRVVVRDPTDAEPGARGKQRLRRGGIWYTPQSGIWQTVWCEAVPAAHVTRLDILPRLHDGVGADRLEVTVHVHGTQPDPLPRTTVVVLADGVEVARGSGPPGSPILLPLPAARRWTPEDPFLHDLVVTAGDDVVRSYAGMRSFGIGPDAAGRPRLLLNGQPYFHAGVLDQGWWSDGMYTPPSDEAMVHDIATMKRLGFTMLRKHAKVEPLRWYHHCDRLGMLVWQDVVNGGGHYPAAVVSAPALVPVRLSDRRHRLFGAGDPIVRRRWLDECERTVELLRSVVSVALWVPFNEGWGQFDATLVAAMVRRWDPTRPIDHASGWYDQGAGDLVSRHIYVRRWRLPRAALRDARRAVALTEYGGYSWRLPDHSASDREFGYRRFRSGEALARAFRRLHEEQVLPSVPGGLAATVYTQLSDVEDETNGLLTYDRRVLKLPEREVRAVIGRLRLPG